MSTAWGSKSAKRSAHFAFSRHKSVVIIAALGCGDPKGENRRRACSITCGNTFSWIQHISQQVCLAHQHLQLRDILGEASQYFNQPLISMCGALCACFNLISGCYQDTASVPPRKTKYSRKQGGKNGGKCIKHIGCLPKSLVHLLKTESDLDN